VVGTEKQLSSFETSGTKLFLGCTPRFKLGHHQPHFEESHLKNPMISTRRRLSRGGTAKFKKQGFPSLRHGCVDVLITDEISARNGVAGKSGSGDHRRGMQEKRPHRGKEKKTDESVGRLSPPANTSSAFRGIATEKRCIRFRTPLSVREAALWRAALRKTKS
jgi:hypothetical protein